MTRLDLYKHASDTAFANVGTTDKAQIDIAGGEAFQSAKFSNVDYPYWRQNYMQLVVMFQNLSTQKPLSAINAAQTPAAAASATPKAT